MALGSAYAPELDTPGLHDGKGQLSLKFAMRRYSAVAKANLVLLVVVVVLVGLCVVWALSQNAGTVTFGLISHSNAVPGKSAFGLTNATGRTIFYRVADMQFKNNDVWREFRGYVPAPQRIWAGPGWSRISAPETLGAGECYTVTVARPMHITAYQEPATAWRIGVVWTYASPTRFEQFRARVLGLIPGRSGKTRPVNVLYYTNFSSEIPF